MNKEEIIRYSALTLIGIGLLCWFLISNSILLLDFVLVCVIFLAGVIMFVGMIPTLAMLPILFKYPFNDTSEYIMALTTIITTGVCFLIVYYGIIYLENV